MRPCRGWGTAVLLLAACGRSGILVEETPDGLCSGDGDGVFATVVLDYDPILVDGDPADDEATDPETALGSPDARPTPPLGAVSLGEGGSLTLGFAPCVLGTDGTPAPDLVIHEYGYLERTTVALLPTARTRGLLPGVIDLDGHIAIEAPADGSGIDLDAALADIPLDAREFSAVRLVDVAGQGEITAETPGADIDAVQAMTPRPDR
jgi:hypothetical protein